LFEDRTLFADVRASNKKTGLRGTEKGFAERFPSADHRR
jgi:hypothetical protein